jgi:hypothetical protein
VRDDLFLSLLGFRSRSARQGITVPSVEQAVERLTGFGATIMKPLGSAEEPSLPAGHEPLPTGFAKVLQKIAFVQDPDGERQSLLNQHYRASLILSTYRPLD